MILQIKDIADVQAGYHSRGPVKADPKGTHRIIQIRDFDDSFHLRTDRLVSFHPDGNPERYLVKAGDILFLSRGQRNFAAVISHPLTNTIAPSYFYIVKLRRNDIDPEYLAWLINSPETVENLKAVVRGSHMPIVPKVAFELFEVRIPALAVQEMIVHVDKLLQRESLLCRQLTEKRNKLVHQICSQRIKNSSIEREPKHG